MAPVSFIYFSFITHSIAKYIGNNFELSQVIEMVPVKLPDIMSRSIMFENMLSIRILEWLVIPAGYKIKGI